MKKLDIVSGTSIYRPSLGAFKFSGSWVSCRDTFHRTYTNKNTSVIEFACGSPTVLADSIWRLERLLNIKEGNLMVLREIVYSGVASNSPHALQINLSPFWLENTVRFFFLTVFIKSMYALKTPFDDNKAMILRLIKSKYCAATSRATAMFLNGCTYNPKTTTNWVSAFARERGVPLTFAKQKRHFNERNPLSNLTQEERSLLEKWVRKDDVKKLSNAIISYERTIRNQTKQIENYQNYIKRIRKTIKENEDRLELAKQHEAGTLPPFMLVGST